MKESESSAVVMTYARSKVFIDRDWMEANAELIDYVQASDGIWVPKCDLVQYESGKRKFRKS